MCGTKVGLVGYELSEQVRLKLDATAHGRIAQSVRGASSEAGYSLLARYD